MHTTPPTLLERVREAGDDAAWGRLVDLYTPLLFAWARRSGASEHDAADLVQEVFVALLQTLPTFAYDQRRGRFRNWLHTLLLNKLRDRKRRQARLDKALQQVPPQTETPDLTVVFEEAEYQQELYRRALQVLQNDFTQPTWRAFWETVVQDRPTADVARELGATENAIYAARFRVLRRLRQELQGLIE
jgi:RNA polymerase sigma-70 factor (ECF subfamily)